MRPFKVLLPLTCILLIACSSNPHYDPSRSHHTPSGFQNVYYDDDKGTWAFLKWKWEQLFKALPRAEDYTFPVDTSRHQELARPTDKTRITWIGHATFLVQFADLNILTDPHFTERASPVSWAGPKRVVPPAITIDALPEIDVVIISHDHYDSLDLGSVKALAVHNAERPVTFLVPLGLKAWFEDVLETPVNVIELDWGQSHAVGGVRFVAEPIQHWSKRTLFDAYERLWASWVIEAEQGRIYFAGDTGYAPHFKNIGEKYHGFDLALLPIGAYEPRWFMKPYHVKPEEAVKIHRDIRSNYSVAMHWGTFILTDEPLDEPPVRLRAALKAADIPAETFEVYRHGEVRLLDF